MCITLLGSRYFYVSFSISSWGRKRSKFEVLYFIYFVHLNSKFFWFEVFLFQAQYIKYCFRQGDTIATRRKVRSYLAGVVVDSKMRYVETCM